MEIVFIVLQIILGTDIEQYEYVWVPRDDTYVKIPIVYELSKRCEEEGYMHCFSHGPIKQIEFTLDMIWYPDKYGCSSWDHEILHAWGYNHKDMEDIRFCTSS